LKSEIPSPNYFSEYRYRIAAMQVIFVVTLYTYARIGKVPGGFDRYSLSGSTR